MSLEPRKCILCNKEFIPKNKNQKYCGDQHYGPCPICGKERPRLRKVRRVLSCPECRGILSKQNLIAKYGRHPLTFESSREKSKIAQAKVIMEKYGSYRNFVKSHTHKPRPKSLKQLSRIRTNRNSGMRQVNYSQRDYLQHPQILTKNSDNYAKLVKHLGLTDETFNFNWFSEVNNSKLVNLECDIFCAMLDVYGVQYTRNKIISNVNYDIYIPDKKTVISVCPTQVYSAFAIDNPKYFAIKSDLAIASGYRCIILYDFDNYNAIAQSLINPIYKISAHKCKVAAVDIPTAYSFANMYSLTEYRPKRSDIAYGLFNSENKLIMIMCICNYCIKNIGSANQQICIVASDPDYQIYGGMAKLMNTFISEYNPAIIRFVLDRGKYTGNILSKLGISFIRTKIPTLLLSKDRDFVEVYASNSYQNQKLFTRAYPNIQFKGKNWKAAVLKLLDEGWLPIYMSEGAYYQWTNPDKNAVTKALPLRTKSDIMITYKALAES